MLACQAVNRSHELAVGARRVRGPAPTLRRKKVFTSEFGTLVRAWVAHRERPEVSVRNRILPIDKPCEIELRLLYRGIRQYRGYRDKGDDSHDNEQHQKSRVLHASPKYYLVGSIILPGRAKNCVSGC